MLRWSVTRDWRYWAGRFCTLLVVVCLLTSSVGAVPVLLSMVAPGNESAAEEIETHSDVRVHCSRHVRLRPLPIKSVGPLHPLPARDGFLGCRQLPRPLFWPCFVGSGIRLRC